jgi:hypothetical protein
MAAATSAHVAPLDRYSARFRRCRTKGLGVARRRALARLTSTWALTLTAVVEVDVAVDVEPIVDLDL